MTRIEIWLNALLLVAIQGALLGHAAEATDKKTTRPNLLFIMTDQQRFDAMSCAGNTVLKTPNLDRIAREGVMFTNSGNLKLMMAEKKANKSVDALYDLKSDPDEMHNLIVSPKLPKEDREQAMRMKARLVKWLQQHEPHKVDDLEDRR